MPRASELGVSFDHWCFACGRANPCGLHLDFAVSEGRVETRYVGRQEHSGYDGTLHGGVVATLIDETMAWATFVHLGTWGVTARLTMTFRSPVRVDQEVRVSAEVVRDRGRALELRGEVRRTGDEQLLAEGEATYLKMPEDRTRELAAKYGDPAGILAALRGQRE